MTPTLISPTILIALDVGAAFAVKAKMRDSFATMTNGGAFPLYKRDSDL